LKRLRRENAILRQERDILKRATAFFAKEGSRLGSRSSIRRKSSSPSSACAVYSASVRAAILPGRIDQRAEISAAVAPGAHAVLILDQAGWHISAGLVIPANITLLPLPAKCPELNPVENVWQFMRDNWLSNRIFKSYDDILDHCCFAWNRLMDQPWRIMSIGLRQWAHG
jgi:hypothetical protein